MMCGKVSEDDLYVLYHEMGHLYYYLSYDNQPQLFRVSGSHHSVSLTGRDCSTLSDRGKFRFPRSHWRHNHLRGHVVPA